MSKRTNALDSADPAHPDHHKPVWDSGDVARFCGVGQPAVRWWVKQGFLEVAVEAAGKFGRSRFVPAAVIAATTTRRVPLAMKANA